MNERTSHRHLQRAENVFKLLNNNRTALVVAWVFEMTTRAKRLDKPPYPPSLTPLYNTKEKENKRGVDRTAAAGQQQKEKRENSS